MPKKSAARAIPTLTVTADKPARVMLRDFIRQQVDGRDAFHLSDLAEEAIAALRNNPEFVDAWLRETLPAAVQAEVQQVVAQTRRHQVMGDYAATPTAIDQRVVRFKTRWTNWREHAGEFGHISLSKMRPLHLREAAKERLQRGRTEMVLGKLMVRLAQGLRENEEVGAKFSDEEIERIYQEINSQEQEV